VAFRFLDCGLLSFEKSLQFRPYPLFAILGTCASTSSGTEPYFSKYHAAMFLIVLSSNGMPLLQSLLGLLLRS